MGDVVRMYCRDCFIGWPCPEDFPECWQCGGTRRVTREEAKRFWQSPTFIDIDHDKARITCYGEGMSEDILEARIPAALNPWTGMYMVLHSHTPSQPCTDACSEYPVTEAE